MNWLTICNLILLLFYIYTALKYYNKLKDTNERFKENEIDYTDLELRLLKLENKIDEDKIEINIEK